MAEQKKSFILYVDLIHTIEKLPNEDAGELFKHILRYVNDKNPTTENILVDVTFEPIKQQLKRDLKAWEGSKEEKSIAGIKGNLKRWNSDLYEQVVSGKITLEQAQSIAEHRRTSQPDKVPSQEVAKIAVNDNVTVNVNDIKEISITPKGDTFDFDIYISQLNKLFNREFKVVNKMVRDKMKSTLKTYTKSNVWIAMQNCKNDTHHKESNYKYCTPEFFARQSTLERHGDKLRENSSNTYRLID